MAEPPQIILTNDSTQHKGAESSMSEELEIVPSSAVVESQRDEVEQPNIVPESSKADDPAFVPIGAPTTPHHENTRSGDKAEETPKSVEDEFVDARSSPEQSSAMDGHMASQGTSFALSEGDESSMMRFVVELESRRCNLPFNKLTSVSPEKKGNESPIDCVTVQRESSSLSPPPEELYKVEQRSESPAVPLTPAEAETGITPSGSKRKRKRGVKNYDSRRKKRRSAVNGPDQVDDSQPAASEDSFSPAPSVRRSLRGRNHQDVEVQEPSTLEYQQPRVAQNAVAVTSKSGASRRDGDGDTDEELLSQLVSESFAASQSHSQVDPTEERYLSEESMEEHGSIRDRKSVV